MSCVDPYFFTCIASVEGAFFALTVFNGAAGFGTLFGLFLGLSDIPTLTLIGANSWEFFTADPSMEIVSTDTSPTSNLAIQQQKKAHTN